MRAELPYSIFNPEGLPYLLAEKFYDAHIWVSIGAVTRAVTRTIIAFRVWMRRGIERARYRFGNSAKFFREGGAGRRRRLNRGVLNVRGVECKTSRRATVMRRVAGRVTVLAVLPLVLVARR